MRLLLPLRGYLPVPTDTMKVRHVAVRLTRRCRVVHMSRRGLLPVANFAHPKSMTRVVLFDVVSILPHPACAYVLPASTDRIAYEAIPVDAVVAYAMTVALKLLLASFPRTPASTGYDASAS